MCRSYTSTQLRSLPIVEQPSWKYHYPPAIHLTLVQLLRSMMILSLLKLYQVQKWSIKFSFEDVSFFSISFLLNLFNTSFYSKNCYVAIINDEETLSLCSKIVVVRLKEWVVGNWNKLLNVSFLFTRSSFFFFWLT